MDEPLDLVRVEETRSPSPDSQHPSSTNSSQVQPLVFTGYHKRIGWHLLLTTLIIVTLSAGSGIYIVLWVTQIHGLGSHRWGYITGTREFLVDEGSTMDETGAERATLRVLTFSSIATQIVSLTAPVMVLMTAYCTAGAWLVEQGLSPDRKKNFSPKKRKNLPTPAQLGLLVKLSSTAGLVAIYETTKYIFMRRQRRESSPPLFHTAFVKVVIIYLITHLVSAADIWLHASASAYSWHAYQATSGPFDNLTSPIVFGVAFNDTLCSDVSDSDIPSGCLVSSVGSEPWGITVPEVLAAGYLTAANATSAGLYFQDGLNSQYSISVITLHDEDDLAVIVPSQGSANTSIFWSGYTYGMRAACRSITPACSNLKKTDLYAAPYDCSGAGYPNFPSPQFASDPSTPSVELAFGPNASLTSYAEYGGENPYEVQLALSWQAYRSAYTTDALASRLSQSSISWADSETLGFVDTSTHQLYVAIAACQIEYSSLEINYDGPGSGSTGYRSSGVSPATSSARLSAIMAGPLLTGTINTRLQMNLAGRVLAGDNNASFLAALNQELGRLPLAMFSGAVVPQPPTSVSTELTYLVSRYEASALVTYVLCLFVYSLLVLVIFIWASTIRSPVIESPDGKTTTALKLAQRILTDPLTLVGLLMPQSLHGVHEGSILRAPINMFGETPDGGGGDLEDGDSEVGSCRIRAPRLEFGIVREGPKAGMIFGVLESSDPDEGLYAKKCRHLGT